LSAEGSRQSPIEAVDRALRVMEQLAQVGPAGIELGGLAQAVGLNKATTHRVLAALRYRDFASQMADGNYVLGPGATQLAPNFYRDENLPELLRPALAALSEAVGELVHLGVLRGRHVVYLDKVEPQRAVRVWSAIGRATPVLNTALGRALLTAAQVGPEVVANYAPDDAELGQRAWKAIERARKIGYATEREENEPGISCLAVALVRGGQPVAAISITAPIERLTAGDEAQFFAEIERVVPPQLGGGLELFRN